MNSYDVVSGVGTNIYEVNVAELINLIDKAPKTKEAIILAGVNLLNPDIEMEDFEEYETPETIIAECLNEIANTESFVIAIDDDGEKYLLFAEKAPWDYTSRERNIEEEDVIRILGYAEKVIEGFEIEDLCIANWMSD